MRGETQPQENLFHVFNLEAMVPAEHPLRGFRERVDAVLRRMNPRFEAAYSAVGRPSIPPEQLIKATLLQALYTIRSERRLCEEIQYNMLFRWFLDLAPDAAVWDHSTFSANRERFAAHGLMAEFFAGSVAAAIKAEAVSDEHFSVDGTLIQAWGSMKSVRPKGEKPGDPPAGVSDSNRWVDWHGEKRSNDTHESKTDPEARLARKGKGQSSMLAHAVHAFMENRNGLLMDIQVSEANGTAECDSVGPMIRKVRRRHRLKMKTLGADKGYFNGKFLVKMEKDYKVKPHVAVKEGKIVSETEEGEARRRAKRRQRTKGYQMSQCCRKRIEEIFGWIKGTGGMRKARFVGRWKLQLYAEAAGAVYNLLRLGNLSHA